MNIFWLDEDPYLAAQYMTDEHVGSKMIIEAAQIIGEALQIRGYNFDFLRSGYRNHPLTQWAAESTENIGDIIEMAQAMYEEKLYRYGGGHKSFEEGIEPLIDRRLVMSGEPSEPPKCVGKNEFGDKFIHSDLVTSYRHYYAVTKVDESSTWTDRQRPEWITEYR